MGHLIQRGFTNGGYILGGFYQGWILSVVNWSTVPYTLLALAVVFVPLKLILRWKARQYLDPFRNGVKSVGDGLCNVVIGGLGTAWFNLAVGLSPFFLKVPVTIGLVALYFLLIVDVFWLKRTFRKASSLS